MEDHLDPLRRESFREGTDRGALPERRIDCFSEDDAAGHLLRPVIETGLAAAVGARGVGAATVDKVASPVSREVVLAL